MLFAPAFWVFTFFLALPCLAQSVPFTATGQITLPAVAPAPAVTPPAAVPGQISIAGYGALCDGVADDTAAIQAAWNAGAALGLNVNLSGVGKTCKISSLTMPPVVQAGEGVLPPVASMLIGDGPNSVTLLSTALGSACAITITTPYASFQPNGEMGGFTLAQSVPQNGKGICLNQVTKFGLRNVFIYGFGVGVSALDTINLSFRDSVLTANLVGVFGETAGNSHPNAWTIERNIFNGSAQYAIELIHPDQINILNNTFESNGTVLSMSPASIFIDGMPIDGAFGANIQGNYFENDASEAIAIVPTSGDARGAFNISNNTFVRLSGNENQMIYVGNTSPIITITLFANGFLDAGSYALGSKPYISLQNPTTPSVNISCLGNIYNVQSSMPAACQVPAVIFQQ